MIATEQTSRRAVAAATVLLDRILGVLALFMVGAFAMFFQDPRHAPERGSCECAWVCFGWAPSAALWGLFVMLHPAFPRSRILNRLIRMPKVGNVIGELVNAVLLYQQRRAIVVLTVLISIVGHFGTLSSFYFCALAINAGNAAPGYWTQLLLIPMARTLCLRGAGPRRSRSPGMARSSTTTWSPTLRSDMLVSPRPRQGPRVSARRWPTAWRRCSSWRSARAIT